jgi:farnesyl diphosphate synthase
MSALDDVLTATRIEMEQALDIYLPQPTGPEARLVDAMRYATLGGGKRIRAFMTIQTGGLFNVERNALLRAASAVECLHAYSLVHDDLPCMDDDDLRRGKPTLHREYDEATAILAGDALQALAFQLLSAVEIHADPFVRADLVHRLAVSAGHAGMVGGQMIDIDSEGREVTLDTITRLQRLKTGALIVFACEAGAILGKASAPQRLAITGYGQDLGLAFQIADDLLDVQGDAAEMGKAAAKDATLGKASFVAVLGPERAQAQAEMLAQQAVAHLDGFDARADHLRALATLVVNRNA